MKFLAPMSPFVAVALLLLSVPVAILLVGFGNVRRDRMRLANAGSEEHALISSRNRRRASYPLPKPPALPEESVGPVRLVRPFALKSQLEMVDPFEGKRRR